MSGLLNKQAVRRYALQRAKLRAHLFTRVGSDFYPKCEAQLRVFIENYIHRLPSKGRTIQ